MLWEQCVLFDDNTSLALPQVVDDCKFSEIDPGGAEDNIKGGNSPPQSVEELASWCRSAGGQWAIKAVSSGDATGFTQIVGGEWVFTFPPDDPKFAQGH